MGLLAGVVRWVRAVLERKEDTGEEDARRWARSRVKRARAGDEVRRHWSSVGRRARRAEQVAR